MNGARNGLMITGLVLRIIFRVLRADRAVSAEDLVGLPIRGLLVFGVAMEFDLELLILILVFVSFY